MISAAARSLLRARVWPAARPRRRSCVGLVARPLSRCAAWQRGRRRRADGQRCVHGVQPTSARSSARRRRR
eukprot:9115879-Alexandrium_andersonii.AAC.1